MKDGSEAEKASSGKTVKAVEGPAEEQFMSKPVAQAEAAGSGFPDGGLRGEAHSEISVSTSIDARIAWLVVLGSWLGSLCSFGYLTSFGVYQAYYETHQLLDETPSNIAWIGSLQLFLILFSGIFTGYLFDKGYHRQIVLTGSVLLVVSVFTTAECKELWQFVLAQGITGGLGAGFVYLPSAAVLAHWFKRRRALVFGIIATGSSVGGVIFPVMLNRLFREVGFKWAVRVAGFVVLASLVLANLLMRPRLPLRARGSFVEFHHLKDSTFSLLVAAAFFIILGIYTPIFYIVTYAESKGVGSDLAFYILAILNAFSILGRLIPNFFADKLGPQNILWPASIIAGILCFVWLATDSSGSIIAFVCFYGPASGSYVSTVPAVIANLTKNMDEIGMRTSLAFAIVSFASLAGTPITGALQKTTGSYVAPACFAGAVVLVGVGFGLVGRQIEVRRTGTWRV